MDCTPSAIRTAFRSVLLSVGPVVTPGMTGEPSGFLAMGFHCAVCIGDSEEIVDVDMDVDAARVKRAKPDDNKSKAFQII